MLITTQSPITHIKTPPHWIVKSVTPLDNYTLLLTFITGEKKVYDCKPLLDKGVFKQLRDLQLFKQAHVSEETVIWNDELDIAAETLYSDSMPVA